MKAVRLFEPGRYPRLEEVAEPTVDGPWDVIVRIAGAGLCRTDLHLIEGMGGGLPLPRTLGHENAGWVAELGSAVSHLAVGDAVILHPLASCGFCLACRRGDDMGCTNGRFTGVTADGGMAEAVKTNARAVVKLPPGLEPRDVAAHADAGLTAYHAVKKAVPRLLPGTTAVVLGAGGLGHIGVQCLKAMTAARVIVVDRIEAALDLAGKLGGDELVLADGTQVQRVRDLTDGAGADVVLDFVGEGGAEQDARALLGRAGIHYVVGYGGTIEMKTMEFMAAEKSVVGSQVGTYSDLVELMHLAATGAVSLHNRIYPLEAVGDAIDDLKAGRLQGRGVLVP
jgi:NAD+-dependent secondary alcohol dehydrogenase Adh1